MTEYEPRLSHIFFALFVGTGCMIGATYWPLAFTWLTIAGAISWFCILLVWMRLIIDTRRQLFKAQTDWLNELRQMDPQQWQSLGLMKLPFVNITWGGETLLVWENTVPMQYFEHFMRTSNDSQTSPERDWNSKEYPQRIWLLIYGKLVQLGFVIPDSASGNRSFRWLPGMCAEAWSRYMTPRLSQMPQYPSPSPGIPQFAYQKPPETQKYTTETDV